MDSDLVTQEQDPAKPPPEGWEKLPDWIRRLGAAVWVSGPDHRIWFVNRAAEGLFGIPARECLGKACHEMVQGVDSEGAAFCSARCQWFLAAGDGEAIEPQLLQVQRAPGERRWVQVVGIPVRTGASDPWLVHCAVDMEWSKRVEGYLDKVATRSDSDVHSERQPLTAREYEVLSLLANDKEMPAVANELHVSRVTVRNHVQHILAKLHVHSIQEAVALFVLGRVGPPRFHPPRDRPR